MHQLRAAQPAESYKVVERERKIDHDLSRLLSQPRYCMSGRAFGVFFLPNHPIIENQGSINFTTQSNL